MDDREFYWDWLKLEVNTLTARGNFFLVAESMLLLAVVRLWEVPDRQRDFPLWLLILGGLFLTTIWLVVNLKHVIRTIPEIQKHLSSIEPRWKSVVDSRSRWPKNNRLLGIFLLWVLVWVLSRYA